MLYYCILTPLLRLHVGRKTLPIRLFERIIRAPQANVKRCMGKKRY